MTGVPSPRDFGLGDADRALLRAAFDEGARRSPAVALSFEEFRSRVLEIAGSPIEPGTASADAVGSYLRRAALADLYLATACDFGDPGAWEALSGAVRCRLEALAKNRMGSAADAEALVQDLLGDLAAPPPRGEARTLLGTFDATGSLLGWLSVVLLRRIQARAQRKKASSLDAQPAGIREAAMPRRAESQPLESGDVVETTEAVRIFSSAFDRAWPMLSAQERLVLTLKHRDDWPQRRIASALAVGEARVSRIVSAAVEKLSEAVRAAAEAFTGDRSEAVRAVFASIVAKRLASSGATASVPTADSTIAGDSLPGPSRAKKPVDGHPR